MCRTLTGYESFLKNQVGIWLWNTKTYDSVNEGLMETIKKGNYIDKTECFQVGYSNSSYIKGTTLGCWVSRAADLMALNSKNLIVYKDLVERVVFSVGCQQIIYNTLEEAERFFIPVAWDSWNLQIKFKESVPQNLVGLPIEFRSYFICDLQTRHRFIQMISNGDHWLLLNPTFNGPIFNSLFTIATENLVVLRPLNNNSF